MARGVGPGGIEQLQGRPASGPPPAGPAPVPAPPCRPAAARRERVARRSSACFARERGLGGGEAGDRHAVGRAGDVVEPARSQNATEAGSPPCSPQMPSLRSGRVARPRSAASGPARPRRPGRGVWNGSPWKMLGLQVGVEELAGIVARQAQRHLGEIVGAEAEEGGVLGDLAGLQGRARQLDHGADQIVRARRPSPSPTSAATASIRFFSSSSSARCRPAGS